MAKKVYDPTLKTIVDREPAAWPELLELPTGPVALDDSDIAVTLSGAADKVLRVAADHPYILHLDFQVGHYSATLVDELLVRKAALRLRHGIRVRSYLVLLRPEADSPQLTGYVEEEAEPGEESELTFQYHVVRVWKLPFKKLLHGPVHLLPLAGIAATTESQLPEILEQVQGRLRRETTPVEAADVLAATYVLLGLRYSKEIVQQLFRRIITMKESVTYQLILEEGEEKGRRKGREEGREEGREAGAVEELRRMLLLLGKERLGPVPRGARSALARVVERARLEELCKGLLTASSWQQLLGLSPAPGPQERRKKPHR